MQKLLCYLLVLGLWATNGYSKNANFSVTLSGTSVLADNMTVYLDDGGTVNTFSQPTMPSPGVWYQKTYSLASPITPAHVIELRCTIGYIVGGLPQGNDANQVKLEITNTATVAAGYATIHVRLYDPTAPSPSYFAEAKTTNEAYNCVTAYSATDTYPTFLLSYTGGTTPGTPIPPCTPTGAGITKTVAHEYLSTGEFPTNNTLNINAGAASTCTLTFQPTGLNNLSSSTTISGPIYGTLSIYLMLY